MAKIWYHILNFDENPLDTRPNPDIIGLEEEEEKLTYHILKGEICFINGMTGSGKTSMLQKVQKNLKGFSFVYLNAEDLPTDFNLFSELQKKRNFFDRISFRKYPKKPSVLMIDEFQATDPNLVLEAKGKLENPEEKALHSMIIAQISTKLKNTSGSFKDRLGKRVIELGSLDDESMKEVLKRRLKNKKTGINYLNKISPEALELLIRCANGSVRRILEYTDIIFDFHHRKFGKNNPLIRGKNYQVLYHGAREILVVNNVNVKGFEVEIKRSDEVEFEEKFTKTERRILKYLLNHEAKSSERLAKRLRMPLRQMRKAITSLKKANALVSAGKKGRSHMWDLSHHAKRQMVKY